MNVSNLPVSLTVNVLYQFLNSLNVIIERGMKIPQDISVAGYDGTQISQILYPKLTTIKQNTELIGEEAAIRLVGAIEKPKTTLGERVVIEGNLVPGQSVGMIQVDE